MAVGVLADVGGSAVKVTAADLTSGEVLACTTARLDSHRPDAWTVEADPARWMRCIATAIDQAVTMVEQPIAALTVASLRQGYILVDGDRELTPLVLNSDRRGRHQLAYLSAQVGSDRLYDVTGHWLAPELTLPKLLQTAAAQPEIWASTTAVLSLHDWLIWRLTGRTVAARSIAGSSQLLQVVDGSWATGLLDEVGLGTNRLPDLVDAGTCVGTAAFATSHDVDIVVGGGDTHVASWGVDGDREGTVVVVAGSSTPLQAAVTRPPTDPLRHPWIGPHLLPGLWAAETNAGYPGAILEWLSTLTATPVAELAARAQKSEPGARGVTAPVGTLAWTQQSWAERPANAVVGFGPTHALEDVARAVIEGHAYSIRSNLTDLERACGTSAGRIVLTGGAAHDPCFSQLVADVLNRPVVVPDTAGAAARAAVRLVGGTAPPVPTQTVQPEPRPQYEDGYGRFRTACELATRYPRDEA
ncbi:MAG: hypothetical protein H0V93_02280 [Euzebyales bacterium]|nr:hypothetical protein [Euzebyales bacterium]